MGYKPTDDQIKAMEADGRTILISAAAGSGKTTTLTQRIKKAVIEHNRDISELLIVTYTRSAAAKLRADMAEAISDAIAEHPDNKHLHNQLIKLGSADICTIDSFFAAPVKANFEKLGLPSGLRPGDSAELDPIREKLMRETLDEFFEKCEHYKDSSISPVGYSTEYTDLMGVITEARDSSKMIPTFWNTYNKLITSPRSIEQLKDHADRHRDNAKKDFFETDEGKVWKEELYLKIKELWKSFRKHIDDMQSDAYVASQYGNTFSDDAVQCHEILNAIEKESYTDVQSKMQSLKFGKLPTLKADKKTPECEHYHELRKKLTGKYSEIKGEYVKKTSDEISSLFERYADMCRILYDILIEFRNKYQAEKLSKGIYDFSDMPEFLLKLLLDENGNETDYAKTLSSKYKEVYIDEYQDVNEIQDTIFKIIGKDHRFMVGDIKQSIYAFREAEPDIFAKYRDTFPKYVNNDTPVDPDSGNLIFMSENFRCSENIIDFANAICSGIFSAFPGKLNYTDADNLKFSKDISKGYINPKISLNIIQNLAAPPENEEGNTGGDGQVGNTSEESERVSGLEAEAMLIANEIARLIKVKEKKEEEKEEKEEENKEKKNNKKDIDERNGDGSKVTVGNIAILVRKHNLYAPITKALDELNIPYSIPSKKDLLSSEEMQLLVDLLSVIDNPRVDIPLYHLLTASYDNKEPEFSLEEIINIRKDADVSKSLYDAIIHCIDNGKTKYIKEKCAKFKEFVDTMRRNAQGMSADKFIRDLVTTKYSALTATEAYAFVYDCACKYVQNTWNSLYSFLRYFKDYIKKDSDSVEIEAKASDRKYVSIMTDHKSKGLEFEVCFLFGFGKWFTSTRSESIIFSKKHGPSMKLPPMPDSTDIIKSISVRFEENPIYKSAKKYNRLMQLEEEARIFYVALTRAKERLYISATINKTYEDYVKDLYESGERNDEIRKSLAYIKWVLLMLPEAREDLYELNIHNAQDITPAEPIQQTNSEAGGEALGTDNDIYVKLYNEALKEDDKKKQTLSSVPSKVAASKVSSTMLDVLLSSRDEESGTKKANMDSDSAIAIRSRIKQIKSSASSFDNIFLEDKKSDAAEIGTATHAVLQFCDYESCEKNGIEFEIERLKNEKFISKRTVDIINREEIEKFFQSNFYKLLRTAKDENVHREFKFGMFREASDFAEDHDIKDRVKDKKIFVQGSIDLLIEMPDGEIILCDYKTDRISNEEKQDMISLEQRMNKAHGAQLKQYEHAIEQIFGKRPGRSFIYLLELGEAIEIK